MLRELEPISNRLDDCRTQLLDTIQQVPEDWSRVPYPGRDWSIHDTLAHLAANCELMTGLAESIADESQTTVAVDFDNERFNAESVAARRGITTAGLLEDLERTQARLCRLLERVRVEQLGRRGTHPLQGDLNLREFLAVMYQHEISHTREIQEQLRRLKNPSGQDREQTA